MQTCQFEDIDLYCETNRMASRLDLPPGVIQDAMAVHALASDNSREATSNEDMKLVSASCLYLACKMRGCKVYMSRFIDTSNLHPLLFRRSVIHISRAVKPTRMEHENTKEQDMQ